MHPDRTRAYAASRIPYCSGHDLLRSVSRSTSNAAFMKGQIGAALLLVVATLSAPGALAQDEEETALRPAVIVPPLRDPEPGWPVRHRWVWESTIAGRVNPLGFVARFDTGYRGQIWDCPGILYEDTFFAVKFASE